MALLVNFNQWPLSLPICRRCLANITHARRKSVVPQFEDSQESPWPVRVRSHRPRPFISRLSRIWNVHLAAGNKPPQWRYDSQFVTRPGDTFKWNRYVSLMEYKFIKLSGKSSGESPATAPTRRPRVFPTADPFAERRPSRLSSFLW